MDYFRSFDGYPMKMMQYRGEPGGRGGVTGLQLQKSKFKKQGFCRRDVI